MATIKCCDGCGRTEKETEVLREYYRTGTVPDGNGGRDDDGQYVDHCHACRGRAAMLALRGYVKEEERVADLFLAAFKNISKP